MDWNAGKLRITSDHKKLGREGSCSNVSGGSMVQVTS